MKPPVIAVLVAAFVLSSIVAIAGFAVATVQVHINGEQQIITAQREVNGTQAMIFATCRAFRRRDLFEEKRLETAASIEMHYQKMTKPFSPTVKAYFHARRVAIVKNEGIQKKEFVDFDCLKGMEKAYLEGYRSSSVPTGEKPIHTTSP